MIDFIQRKRLRKGTPKGYLSLGKSVWLITLGVSLLISVVLALKLLIYIYKPEPVFAKPHEIKGIRIQPAKTIIDNQTIA